MPQKEKSVHDLKFFFFNMYHMLIALKCTGHRYVSPACTINNLAHLYHLSCCQTVQAHSYRDTETG